MQLLDQAASEAGGAVAQLPGGGQHPLPGAGADAGHVVHRPRDGLPGDPDDLREARYRVPTAEYELPEDITFTPAELALLNLAGGVWSESSMSAEARSGLRKLLALGIVSDCESHIVTRGVKNVTALPLGIITPHVG